MAYKSTEEARAKARAYALNYYYANLEKCREARRKYYRKNKRRINDRRVMSRKRTEESRAKARTYALDYYHANAEKCRASRRKYYMKNRHKILAEAHIAYALRRMEQNEKRRRQSVESSMASFGLLGFA